MNQIPPSNPTYNAKYVKVYDATPDTVTVGYTPGYTGSYVDNGTVVYGTGYDYSGLCRPGGLYPAPGHLRLRRRLRSLRRLLGLPAGLYNPASWLVPGLGLPGRGGGRRRQPLVGPWPLLGRRRLVGPRRL